MNITEAGKIIIRDLYQQHGDILAPRKILDHATDPASPLHGCFNWDDASAADAHRLDQARSLMRRVVIFSVPSSPAQLNVTISNAAPPSPAFVVPDPRRGYGGYVAIGDVAGNPDSRMQMFATFKRDMEGLAGRLKNFQTVLASQGASGSDVDAFSAAIDLLDAAIAAMPQAAASEEAA